MCFKNQNGMTLVELMAAIAISGALAAIAIPKYQSMSVKAKNVELKIHLNTFYKAMDAYTIFNGTAPDNIEETGYTLPNSSFYSYSQLGGDQAGGNTGKGAAHKMTVCHEGHPINVAKVSVYNAHLEHGDHPDKCPVGLQIVPNFAYSSECPSGSTLRTFWNEGGIELEDDVDGMCTENI